MAGSVRSGREMVGEGRQRSGSGWGRSGRVETVREAVGRGHERVGQGREWSGSGREWSAELCLLAPLQWAELPTNAVNVFPPQSLFLNCSWEFFCVLVGFPPTSFCSLRFFAEMAAPEGKNKRNYCRRSDHVPITKSDNTDV